MSSLSEQAKALLALIPETGSIGNVTLRRKFLVKELTVGAIGEVDWFSRAKQELLAAGLIQLGRGKGGSVRRASVRGNLNLETGQITESFESKPCPVSEQDRITDDEHAPGWDNTATPEITTEEEF